MGAPGILNSTCITNYSLEAIPANPNPENYNVISFMQFDKAFILKIHYENCTNYEGLKIILYKGKFNPLMLQAPLDPHFCELQGKYPKPFARFEPTDIGMDMAIQLAKLL